MLLLAAFLFAGMTACRDSNGPGESETVRFAVIADPHLYDSSLGTSGPVFDAYTAAQVKMIALGETIFEEAIRLILEMDPLPEFILIPGDLTKDGEEKSHLKMVEYLKRFRGVGIDVYVVPGNHDIDNPEAASHGEYGFARVYSPDAEGFAGLYEEFGYARAISRDPNSLSYVAEPVQGLWLFAIDSCRYGENVDYSIVGGRLGRETRAWLRENLQRAVRENKRIVGMMHHGLVPHFEGQGELMPDFLVEDWESVGHELASASMRIIFTGHYHTQNITRHKWDDETDIVEVQTGSLLTYPVPLRVVDFDMQAVELDIKSIFIRDLPAGVYPGEYCCFASFAESFTRSHTKRLAVDELKERFDLCADEIETYAQMLTEAAMAHFAGDERPTWSTLKTALDLSESDDEALSQIGLLLLALWWDLPPADNEATLEAAPL